MFSKKPTSSLSALFGGSSSGSQGLSRPRKQTNDDAFDEESSDDEDSSALSYKPVKKANIAKGSKTKVAQSNQQKPQQHDLNGVSEPDQQEDASLELRLARLQAGKRCLCSKRWWYMWLCYPRIPNVLFYINI